MIKPTSLAALGSVVISTLVFSMPYGIGCATDINADGVVGVGDVLTVIDRWGTNDAAADCNGDGVVSVSDLLMLIDEWGVDCESIHPFTGNTMVMFDYAGGFIVITTNGIPEHPTGPFDGSTGCFNPNSAMPQDRTYRIPMNPQDTNNPAVEVMDQMGPISIANNGVPFYNPYDAGGIDAPSSICFDDYNGHPQLFGEYHYHQWSPALDNMETDGHSGIVGYAFDGYPIFGPWESDGIDAHNLIVNALDGCHGHSDGIRGYHYHTSLPYAQDPNGFPWVLGCYTAEPEMSNFDDAGGGGGGCDACAQLMIPPNVCNCVHTTPGYEYCCTNWDANCQAYADQFCANGITAPVPTIPLPPTSPPRR